MRSTLPTGASQRQSESRWERRQRRFMAALLLLIPLAVPLGLFAPNFVGIVTTGPDPFPGDDLAPDEPRVKLDHEPPRYRNFTRSSTPPPTHTARLARLLRRAPTPPPLLALAPSAPDPKKSIEVLFPSGKKFGGRELPLASIATFQTGEGSYIGSPVAPEPGTGLLLGSGLIALAAHRRSVRRARSACRKASVRSRDSLGA